MRNRFLLCLGLLCGFAGAVGAAELRTLAVDTEHTRIEVAVHATVDSFVGRLSAYQADLAVEPDSGQIRRAEVRFRFADLKTGKADRDAKMLAWEESGKFPDGVFVLTTLQPRAGGQYDAQGTLTLHGVQRPIAFPVTLSTDHNRTYTIDGEARLDTRDFQLPIIRMALVLKVDPIVVVRFHLQANAP